MKECLEYVKEIVTENNELNREIKQQKDTNIALEQVNKDLEVKNVELEKELERTRALANKWWHEYEKLHDEYSMIDAQYNFLAEAFGQLSPQLMKEVDEDLEEGIFSEIVSNFSRRNRWR